jgi:MFS transporter, DHA1 family, tetracycline resistance protein
MIGNRLQGPGATHTLYILNFLLGVHIALVVYFNSSFLQSRGISEDLLGTLYVAGSILSLVVLYFLPKILDRFGNFKVMIVSIIAELFIFTGIALCACSWVLIALFALSIATSVPLFFGLDILLESSTKSEAGTGETRSMFLTAINIAFVASPFFAGQILGGGEYYARIYLISAMTMLPVLALVVWKFKRFKDPVYKKVLIKPVLKNIVARTDIRNILVVQFMMRFFFSWMVIYTPLYLAQYIGFSLSQIGVLFSIMLIPFALLEYPLGHYIDKRFGEKEFLIIGFIILILSTAAMSFVTIHDFLLWAVILVMTRIGAATIEVMNEIYFFKHVDSDDLDSITAFRSLRPFAYIIGPAAGSTLLTVSGMQPLFLLLAIIMTLGLVAACKLRDTR